MAFSSFGDVCKEDADKLYAEKKYRGAIKLYQIKDLVKFGIKE